jgi:formylglycine-generating enzyme required for sulfatase activity
MPLKSLPLLIALAACGLALLITAPPLAAQTFATNTPPPAVTRTPAPALTGTPLPPALSVSVIMQQANVRAEPSLEAAVLTQVFRGENLPVINLTGAGSELWYQVRLRDGTSGWLFNTTSRRVVIWSPKFQLFDGVEMALVPPGCFIMGGTDGEDDEQPPHPICFTQPFWIDRTEVTNAAYGAAGYFSGGQQPRESVTWADAAAFCAARGARLPTEAEWEYAARGPNGSTYPWGDTFVAANAVSSWVETARQTEAVGSRLAGASWVGALDMAGNVWEWTSSIYKPYPYSADDGRESPTRDGLRVVRGGACCSYVIADVRSAYRFPVDPRLADPNVGFRCVRD